MTEAVTGGDESVAAAESFNLATDAVTVNNVETYWLKQLLGLNS